MGHPDMNPKAQIEDSLQRGWIVLAPDHRLCPQLNILEGPMGDIRSLHAWVHSGALDSELWSRGIPLAVAKDKIIATGSASGGHACLGLAFAGDSETTSITSIPPPAAIIDLYAPKNFTHSWWTGPRDKLEVNVPPLTAVMERLVFSEHPIPSRVDLPAKPDHSGKIVLPDVDSEKPSFVSARVSYATNVITEHRLLDVCWPRQADRQHLTATEHYRPIDPILNVHPSWPPTCFVHGIDDNLLPHTVTTEPLMSALEAQGVRCKFVGIEGGKHMFVMSMTRGSREWERMKEAMDWVAGIIDGE
jgi:acetyl esterase/lipase